MYRELPGKAAGTILRKRSGTREMEPQKEEMQVSFYEMRQAEETQIPEFIQVLSLIHISSRAQEADRVDHRKGSGRKQLKEYRRFFSLRRDDLCDRSFRFWKKLFGKRDFV